MQHVTAFLPVTKESIIVKIVISRPGATHADNRALALPSGAVVSSALFRGLTLGLLLLSGCAIQPKPVDEADFKRDLDADRRAAEAMAEPISGPLTIEEAIARALKFNLERRVRMLEEAVALGQHEAGRYDMLPKLLAQAGYRYRSEELITRSKDSVTGQPSLANPFISSDRASSSRDLGLTWSLLDFGTSYFNARQNADRVMIAAERRRRAMHLLMQDVRSAFWRTVAAQRLSSQVQEAIKLAEEALQDARKVENERVRGPVDSLRFQRQLLENLRLLETAQQELSTARIDLLHLINAPLVVDLRVVEPAESLGRRVLDAPVSRLEQIAVERNADLREQFHNSQIAVDETRKVLTRLFPNLSFNFNVKYDSNSYLVNRDWNEAGVSLSYNLFNLLSGPAQQRLAEAGVALADQRRMATQMATLAQVHRARIRYANSLVQLGRAEEIADIDGRIARITADREAAQASSKLEAVANRTTSILAISRLYQALSDSYTAASRLQATLGLEPDLAGVQDTSLNALTAVVRESDQAWREGRLPGDSTPPPRSRLDNLSLATVLETLRPVRPAPSQPVLPEDEVPAPVLLGLIHRIRDLSPLSPEMD